MNDFRGRVAVVTGGASGIGRALAERFAAEGMKVAMADVEQPALDQAVAAIRQRGGDAMGVLCDVASRTQVASLAETVFQAFGAVHVLCNNAGVSSDAAPSWSQSETDWKWVLGVNLWGVIHGIGEFVPRMLKQESEGHIVNTASLSGLLSMPYGAPYNVSKFGVVALTEALHYELIIAKSRLRASVLCPAWVRTGILDSARNRPVDLANQRPAEIDREWLAAFQARLDEGLTPEYVATRVLEAIREERLYIWTHPEYRRAVELRHEDVLAGRNPDIARMLRGLGEDAHKAV